jgi:hypothetical protein
MARNADEIVVANSGDVYFGAVGATLPQPGDDPAEALDAALAQAGFITEDGATLSVGSETLDIMAWQSRQAVRREKTAQEIAVSFAFQQWNEDNVPFAFGGGTVTDEGGGLYSYVFPDDDEPLDERCLVIDSVDGDKLYRFVFPRGNVTDAVETQFKRGSPSQLPIAFKVLEPVDGGEPAWLITNDPAFAGAGS